MTAFVKYARLARRHVALDDRRLRVPLGDDQRARVDLRLRGDRVRHEQDVNRLLDLELLRDVYDGAVVRERAC